MKSFPVKVLGDRVLLRRVKDKPQVIGDIVIPDAAAREPFQEAAVLSVGRKVWTVKPGDHVIISRHADRPTIPYKGELLDVVPEMACLIRVEREDAPDLGDLFGQLYALKRGSSKNVVMLVPDPKRNLPPIKRAIRRFYRKHKSRVERK